MEIVQRGFVGLKIILSTVIDISAGTVFKIFYRKPSNQVGEWVAVKETNSSVSYTTTGTSDLDEAGVWEFQAYVETPSWKGFGKDTGRLDVHENLPSSGIGVGESLRVQVI